VSSSTAAPVAARTSTWSADAAASVVVFLVALPLCLGLALASGAPLISGIIAGIIGGLLVGALSGSNLMVSGPAAGLTAIVLAAITDLGGFTPFLTAVVLSGILQIGFGMLKAGVVASYVPSSVIRGMLSAIGLILILKQLPYAVGYDADVMRDVAFRQANDQNAFSALAHLFSALEPVAILCSAVGLALLVLWPRIARGPLAAVPGALAVVLAGVAINALAGFWTPERALGVSHLVGLPLLRSAAEAVAALATPDWSRLTDPAVLRVAVTLAMVASLETLLSLEATDRLDPAKRLSPPNRELVAQGIGNTLSGLVGGLPITGVIVRSAANISAGGRTRKSAILHGALLLVAVAWLPGLLNRIPLAALAVILIFTGLKLASVKLVRSQWSQGTESFVPFAATVAAILLTDLLIGIGVGLVVAAGFILRARPLTPGYRIVSPNGAVLVQCMLDDQVTFCSKARILKLLNGLAAGTRIEINGTRSRRIDRDVIEMLHEFTGTAADRGIDYRLVSIPAPVGDSAGAH